MACSALERLGRMLSLGLGTRFGGLDWKANRAMAMTPNVVATDVPIMRLIFGVGPRSRKCDIFGPYEISYMCF